MDADPTFDRGGSSPVLSSPVPTQDLPCTVCRRRKIRCSKSEPCSNCQRAGVRCVYEDTGRLVNRRTPKGSDAVGRRIAELEELVRNLSRRPRQGNPMEVLTQNLLDKSKSQGIVIPGTGTGGKLVFDQNRSRYLHKSFWAAMYDEITDLKFMLEEEPTSGETTFLFPYSGLHQNLPPLAHPPIPESDFLVQTFLEKVDPFVKVLHRPTLQLELNHFRRGILTDAREFECRLFAIYSLAVLHLCPTLVEYRLHESKKVMLSRYRSFVERGLSHLKLTTSHSLSTLQTFLLYITFLSWTGEILHVSTLLAMAFAMARRMGLNRDGTSFPLGPWQVELRRRLWHHLVLVDSWCVENHGLQSLTLPGEGDTSFPQNTDDASWDTSEFAATRPAVQNNFTDLTVSLLQFEVASLTTFVLDHPYTPGTVTVGKYLDFHSQVLRQAQDRIDILYLRHLDQDEVLQRLAGDLFELALKRLRLMQLQPILNVKGDDIVQRPEIEAKLYQLAIDYCKTVQRLLAIYTPHGLDMAVIRSFSWHSVATMLSMVLRHEALQDTPEARAASHRIEKLFQNRPSIDYLAGNDNLWEPLRKLRTELAAREHPPQDTAGDVGSEVFAAAEDPVSLDETYIDPSLFGFVGEDHSADRLQGVGGESVETDMFGFYSFT